MILWQVLQLNDTTSLSTCSICTIELKHASCTTIRADGVLHGLILFDRGFRQLQPQFQHRPHGFFCRFDAFLHLCLSEGIGRVALRFEPAEQLVDRVGVFQVGQGFHPLQQLVFRQSIHADCLLHQLQIHLNTPVVDGLVKGVFLPDKFRHGEA